MGMQSLFAKPAALRDTVRHAENWLEGIYPELPFATITAQLALRRVHRIDYVKLFAVEIVR
jgi:hypothetical protein